MSSYLSVDSLIDSFTPPAVARISDQLSCGDFIMTGSPNVFVNGLPVARKLDFTTGHTDGDDWWKTVPIISGSRSVFVNRLPIARVEDVALIHCASSCHVGKISEGSRNVFAK